MKVKVTHPSKDILKDEMIKRAIINVWSHRPRDDESKPTQCLIKWQAFSTSAEC